LALGDVTRADPFACQAVAVAEREELEPWHAPNDAATNAKRATTIVAMAE